MENIEMNRKETGWEAMDWINLAQDMNKWQAVVKMVMNLWVLSNVGNFLINWEAVSFTRKTCPKVLVDRYELRMCHHMLYITIPCCTKISYNQKKEQLYKCTFQVIWQVTEILYLQAASPVCAELETIVLDWFGKFIMINMHYLSSMPLPN
jgi:hypothetical protein